MQKSDSIKNLAAALAKFQSEIENPKNTADNPFFKSKYAPLNDVLNTVRPLLSKHGLSVIQSPGGDGQNISINTLLIHESGEWIEFDPLVLKAEKMTPQGAGSAVTYGRRYSLSAVLGISSEDDDDGNHASNNQKKKSSQNQQQNKQETKDPKITSNTIGALKSTWMSHGKSEKELNEWIQEQFKKPLTQLNESQGLALLQTFERKKESA